MKKRRGALSGLISLAVTAQLLSGCGITQIGHKPLKLTLTTNNMTPLVDAIKEKFPEINLDIEYYCGPDAGGYIAEQLEKGDMPDILFSPIAHDSDIQKQYLMDISGYDFVQDFDLFILDQHAIGGRVYELPVTYSVRAIAYNKTLFEKHGWTRPSSHGELVELVKRIKSETDITPITFSGIYTESYFNILTTLAQCDFLFTPAGTVWETNFKAGSASAQEGMRTGIELLQEVIDAGAFSPRSAEYDDDAAYEQLTSGNAAMSIAMVGQSSLMEMAEEKNIEIGYIPFYGEKDYNRLLSSLAGMYFGLSADLPQNKEKLKDALKIARFLSTEEGQTLVKTNESDILTVNSENNGNNSEAYEEIADEIKNGYIASLLYSGYEDVIIPVGEEIKKAMLSGGSLENVTAVMDSAKQSAIAHSNDTVYGSIDRDMTHEETVQLFADIMRDKGLGDIALVSSGGMSGGVKNQTGVNGRLYAGDITTDNCNIILPALGDGNLKKLRLTGNSIKELIESGRHITDDDGKTGEFKYYASGIDVSSLRGKKRIKNSGGAELDMDAEYDVIMVEGDFDSSLKAEDTEVSVTDLWIDYLKINSPVTVRDDE